MSAFSEHLETVQVRIARAEQKAGRAPQSTQLVAVTKGHPPERVREAIEAGLTVFGENRVQELLAKSAALPSSVSWHLIGHLQSNKIRKVLPVCSLIHSVDSVELAQDIDRIAAELGLFPQILLQVNVSGEPSKFGFKPDSLISNLSTLLELKRASVIGMMTMAPLSENPESARPVFRNLRGFRDRCEAESGTPLPVLSMGMTGDFEVAIEEGATHVRIGSALFV